MREGDESNVKPDPSWGYTGHPYAKRYDKGEEDLSMASRINRRRQQAQREERETAEEALAKLAPRSPHANLVANDGDRVNC